MIIGLVGKLQSGKDTAALMLAEYGVRRYAFADYLKQVCSTLFNLDFFNEDTKKAHREKLQIIGEAARQCDPDVWSSYVLRKIKDENTQHAVITDVRHINEMRAVKKSGGILVRINRPGTGGTTAGKHISETQMDTPEAIKLVDYCVDNSGSLDEFRAQLSFLCAKLGLEIQEKKEVARGKKVKRTRK